MLWGVSERPRRGVFARKNAFKSVASTPRFPPRAPVPISAGTGSSGNSDLFENWNRAYAEVSDGCGTVNATHADRVFDLRLCHIGSRGRPDRSRAIVPG